LSAIPTRSGLIDILAAIASPLGLLPRTESGQNRARSKNYLTALPVLPLASITRE